MNRLFLCTAFLAVVASQDLLDFLMAGPDIAPWEWAGAYSLPAGSFTWTFAKTEGVYGLDSKTVIFSAVRSSSTSCDKTALTGIDASVKETALSNAVTLPAGTPLTPDASDSAFGSYTIDFAQDTYVTMVPVVITTPGCYVLFADQSPYSLLADSGSFFHTSAGVSVEPEAEIPPQAVFAPGGGAHDHGDGAHDHGDGAHDHGGGAADADAGATVYSDPWEWAATHVVAAGSYTWTAEKRGGMYGPGDADMLIAVLMGVPAKCGKEFIESTLPTATQLFSAPAQPLAEGGLLMPSNTTVYKLQFNEDSYMTMLKMYFPSFGCAAIYTQHSPYEFEVTTHFFKAASGENIEPTFEANMAPVVVDKWAIFPEALFSVFVCSAPSLLGVIMLAPAFKRINYMVPVLNAFAAGVLIGGAFMHMYPEGVSMVEYEDDVERMWKTGLAAIGGALFGFVMDLIFPDHSHGSHGGGAEAGEHAHGGENGHEHGNSLDRRHSSEAGEESPMKGKAGNGTLASPQKGSAPTSRNSRVSRQEVVAELAEVHNEGRLVFPKHSFCDIKPIRPSAWSLCMGDAMHNITDGVMIAAAFISCSSQMGWIICGVMLAHELPGEIGDFFLLINAGMSLSQAVFWNFFSGLTAMAGLLVVFLADVNATDLGLMLLVGAGVFVYISFCNLVPEILHTPNGKGKWLQVFSFLFGIAALGATVAGHQHCNAAEGSAMASLHGHDHGAAGGASHH